MTVEEKETSSEAIVFARPAYRTKLIEVALPLEAINVASAREKSIRHGHPSTLHLWWARRPLATCRAVLFAQMVDDPSAVPEEFPTEEEQEAERQRLFRIIEQLVVWENSRKEEYLMPARREIARSVARSAAIPGPDTDDDVWRILREHAPPVLDPFCGGGSIPLEAQRLGLEAHASDLNPVAVLITKALIEIPPKFAGMPPVNPRDRDRGIGAAWKGAAGLTADVRYYGEWMREEAFKRIGHLYPKVKLPPEQGGGEATVIAWLWARTVICPNPACGARMPLVHSFALSTRKGKETWVEPILRRDAKTVRFEVRGGKGKPPEPPKVGRGAKFRCLVCEQIADDQHVKDEAKAERMGQQLLVVVAEGQRGRVYVSPSKEQGGVAEPPTPPEVPDQSLANDPRAIWCVGYGLDTFDKLFTPRQLVALTTFSDLVGEVREQVLRDSITAGFPDDVVPLEDGGNGASACADALATYLALGVSRLANRCSSICFWDPGGENVQQVFARQAIPMTWDFTEGNPFSDSSGNFLGQLDYLTWVVEDLPCLPPGEAQRLDAMRGLAQSHDVVIATDPPYYDNIGYADLSDYFYVWLRRSLRSSYQELFSTLLVPKTQELVATPYRFGGSKERAQEFFEQGLVRVFAHLRAGVHPACPLTLFYAFKQSEAKDHGDSQVLSASTGWETMLTGLLRNGFAITGTWPVRSELTGNLKKNVGALASSIVIVCRPRLESASLATRREFISALRQDLPKALIALQHGNIAPVDLAQASIGPGMAIFSRYAKVLEADGSPMSVRTALQIINQELDAYLTALEGEMDPDTRFCVAWFEQFGMQTARFGEADVLARAKNISVEGLVRAGVLRARGGEVRLLSRGEMGPTWDPRADERPTDWECAQHLILALDREGEDGAARLASLIGADKAQIARDLAYRLYAICERKGWADEALAYNTLVVSWPAIQERAASAAPEQGTLI